MLRVAICRPQRRNALSLAVLGEIERLFTVHAGAPALRLAVIRGEGDKAFAAGGDLVELDALRTRTEAEMLSDRGRSALDAIRNFPVPVVAAVNGAALGGGAELALACDFRFAAAHAALGLIHARLGIVPSWGGGVDLMRLLGPSAGLRHLVAAEAVGAEEALRVGLIDALAGSPDFENELEAYLSELAARPPQVMRALKQMSRAVRMHDWAELNSVEREQFANVWIHPDHWAAVVALSKKAAGNG